MIKTLPILLLGLSFWSCTDATESPSNTETTTSQADTSIRIVPASEIVWEALNPARGDMSPRAGTLWGDRKEAVPTGFLAKFVDGFSSPPHIHNVTYRAVVIDGLIHNDDPNAENMWMPSGSFWTQPKGEAHITSAKGASNIALVEIDRGPYLVKPTAEAFDSGERPLNVDAGNLVWLPFSEESDDKVAQISYLWGQVAAGQWYGSFIKLPSGFSGTLHTAGTVFHSVVIQGSLVYGAPAPKNLQPGSYVGAEGASLHRLRTEGEEDTLLYIRTNGLYRLSR